MNLRHALLAGVPVLILAAARVGAPPEAALPSARKPLRSVLAELPGRNVGQFGRPGEPLNLLFIGSGERIRRALERAGWAELDTSVRVSFFQGLADLAEGRGLRRFPPMMKNSLAGRVQDLNFAIPVRSIFSRHHFRLWRLPYVDEKGRPLWWGSGSFDAAVRWRDLSHLPAPDTTQERDFIALTLENAGARLSWVSLPQIPLFGENDRGLPFVTDGRLLLAEFTP